MKDLIKVKISAKNKELSKRLNNYNTLSIIQNIYGLISFKIVYRLDSIEERDSFPIHNSSDLIGQNIIISSIKIEKKDVKTIKNYKVIIFHVSSQKHSVSSKDKIEISGFSPDMLLNSAKKSRAFINMSLNDIIQKIMRPYPKPMLSMDIKPKNKLKIQYTVQHEETDLEFLRRLSNRYGEWFYFNGKKICFGELPNSKSELVLGKDLDNFNYDLKLHAVKNDSVAYDSQMGRILKNKNKTDEIKGKLDRYHKKIVEVAEKTFQGSGHFELKHLPNDDTNIENIIKDFNDSRSNANVINMAKIEAGSILPDIELGQKIQISALNKEGNKFSYGEYVVEELHHFFKNNYSYKNHMVLQSSKSVFPRNTNPELYPECHDLKKALVVDAEDPDKLGRIKVKFPWMDQDGDKESPWLHVNRPFVNKNGGMFFLPEIGTEVLVGFEGGNMERPYVYGSLYSKGTFKPDNSWKKENYYIRSVAGHTIHFADEAGKQNIEIYDADGCNKITFSSSDKKLIIESTGDIEIVSKGDINMKSDKKLILNGTTGIEISTNSDINLNAKANITSEAKGSMKMSGTEFKAEGKGTAEISSAGITTVKGSMVKIN